MKPGQESVKRQAMAVAALRAANDGRDYIGFVRSEDRGDGMHTYFYVRPADGSEGEAPAAGGVVVFRVVGGVLLEGCE